MKLQAIAELTGGRIIGDPDVEISGVSGIRDAKEGDVSLIIDTRTTPPLPRITASAVIAKKEVAGLTTNMLLVDNPRLAFSQVLEIFHPKPACPTGISADAFIGDNVHFGKAVTVHPLACICDNAVIGTRTTIHSSAYIGYGVVIGDETIVHPNVTIREGVKIGKRVIIHAGTVIGSDGFGYVTSEGTHHKIPQVGGVTIGDDVEIGSNVSIDRATTGTTVIGSGTKIDNLVQIAHNVKIGTDCLIVAQTGISGSVEIGNGTVMGGQTGVRDHIKIGNRAMIGAGSGVAHDIPDDQIYSGYPAIPHKRWLRAQSLYAKLPEYIKRLHALEKKSGKEGSSHD